MRMQVDITWHDEYTDKLIFDFDDWKEIDQQCCVHGIKLRWICEACEEISALTDLPWDEIIFR